MTMDKQAHELAQWAMDQAKKAGAQTSAVHYSARREVQVEVRVGQIDKLQESTGRSLSLELYVDGRYSSHSTQKLDRPSLKSFIQNAVALTRYLAKDEFRHLPEAELSKLLPTQDLQRFDPAYRRLDTPQRIERAKAAEAAARSVRPDLISTSSYWIDVSEDRLLLNSLGFQGDFQSTAFGLYASATVKDGERGRPEGYEGANTCHLDDLPSAEKIGRGAVNRAAEKIGQSKLPSGLYDLVIENRIVGRLVDGLLDPMTAEAIQQKNSFLEGKLGQLIASPKLCLMDDPFLSRGLASARFDEEGLALQPRKLIDKGELKTYLVDNYYGRKLKLKPNGGSVSNLRMEGGEGSQEELLKRMGKGILVQGFIGGNSNGTTGDFSFGLVGQYVENGRIVKPINEMNLSGNLLAFWKTLDGLAADPYIYSSYRLPSLLFRGAQLSGS